MRQISRKLLFLFVPIFLLCSCSADSDDITALGEHLKNLGEERYIAHITAIFPKREVSFSLDWRFFKDRDDRVTVIAPEEISGVAFSVSESDATLEFEGARLTMESLDEKGTSPLSAVPSLISAWQSGNFNETLSSDMFGEDAYLVICKNNSENRELEYRTWFSKADFYPLYAEIFSGGIRIIECKFERTN